MHLKSLVLKGFKSFADRSVLTMEPGITAIVGPNGSGKSNISDAVLWVLGERNAKHLRGQAMEDVIFAGSTARKSVGVAEVDLVLDNSDGTLPVDYNEVAITRRMYRSGESEYLINGVIARRMDVLDILHDSGLGTGTRSIISQGSLDSVLQSKPEDLRALIEEAAGVLKHKQRKAKSERKLAAMDAHLARVKDITSEVGRQLAPLERKAKRAQTYQDLSAQLAEIRLSLAVDDLRELRRGWSDIETREKNLETQLEERRIAITQVEEKIELLQEKIRIDTADAGEMAQRQRRASSVIERFDGAALLLHEKRRAAQNYQVELHASLQDVEAKRTQAKIDHAQAASQLEEASKARAAADASVARLREEQSQATDKHCELEREVERLTKAKQADEQAQERARKELMETQESLANGLANVKVVEAREKELQLQFDHIRLEVEELTLTAQTAKKNLEDLTHRETQARTSVGEALAMRDSARKSLDEVRETVSMLALEIKGLEEFERAAAGSESALSWLLENAEALGVVPLSHVLRASQGFETLVERLLGADVSALLVDDTNRACSVAASLEESSRQGEVTLVSRSDARRTSSLAREAAAKVGGHALIDDLSYPLDATHAIETLLGDVVVCDNKEHAYAAYTSDMSGARFVTNDGSILWQNGRMIVAHQDKSDTEGTLARARRLDSLRKQYSREEESLRQAEEVLYQAEEVLRNKQAASLKLSQDLAKARGESDALWSEARRAENRLETVCKELEQMQAARAEAEQTVADKKPFVQAIEERLEELARTIEEESKALEDVQAQVVPQRKQAACLRDSLAETRLEATKQTERETYAARMVDARLRDIDNLIAEEAEARKALTSKTVALTRVEPLLALFEELIRSARNRAQILEDAAVAAHDSSAGLHTAVNDARAAARIAHANFDETNGLLSDIRVEKGRLEVKVQAAIDSIVKDLGVPLDQALELPKLECRAEVEETSFKLQRRITNLGTVNLDAAQEYEALKERHDYLSAQLIDLESARRSLTKIVRVIDARMKDDFVNTYEAVDKNFQEIFGVLFPGGQAHLVLSNPDNMEETGVEVTAQPRGKRITKMMLMSGGEKSLTALALLFAVYRIRSTPFYILDEVEAALDDSNLRRLTAYLETLRNSTQLIMITHQRRTMEMADVLFGVSMQEDGVTKVISQRLDRALQYAE